MEPSHEIKSGTKTPSDPSSRAPYPLLPNTPLASTSDGAKDPPGRATFSYPSQRARHFIPRHDILRELEALLQKAADRVATSVIVLVGMGGCGKTQLALEYCRRGREKEDYESIFWVDASNPSSVAQSFAKLEELIFDTKVELQNAEASVNKVIGIMSLWEWPWMIVFDNFDQPELFNQKVISDYFPRGEKGHILITSRSVGAGKLGQSISVNNLSENEGLELLELSGNTRVEHNMEPMRAIVHRLGYHALALDQAGAYISARGLAPELFIKHYEKRKQKVLEETPSFWAYKMKLADDEAEIALNAFTTWEMSFDQIRDDEISKVTKNHLINVSAFFDSQDILGDFFKSSFETMDVKSTHWMEEFCREGIWSEDGFEGVITELRGLSLLNGLEIPRTGLRFSIHPLIKDWIKLKKAHQDRDQYSIEAINMLSAYLNAHEIAGMALETKRILIPHLREALENNSENLDHTNSLDSPGLKLAAFNFARFYEFQGQFKEAKELYEKATTGWGTEFGAQHIDTLRIVGNLATINHAQGNYEEAERLYKRVLDGAMLQLPENHVDILQTLHNLSIVYNSQKRFEEAESFCKKAIDMKEKNLGSNDPGTLRSVETLAIIYRRQGKCTDAEPLYKRVLRKTKLDADHPSTLRTLYNLAICYEDQGKLEEAEGLFKAVLQAREDKLGSEHYQTIRTADILSSLQASKGCHYKAEKVKGSF